MTFKIIVSVCVIFVLFLHITAMDFVYKKGKKFYRKSNIKIWDIIHSNFDDYSRFNYAKNMYLLLFLVPILFNLSKISVESFISFISEFFYKFMIIVFLRSLTIAATIFPKNCKFKVKKSKNIWSKIYNKIICGGCYDKIFSGHMSFGLLLTLLLFKYNFLELNVLNTLLFTIINVIHVLILGVTRSHFTVDMIVATYVTLFVHQINLNFN